MPRAVSCILPRRKSNRDPREWPWRHLGNQERALPLQPKVARSEPRPSAPVSVRARAVKDQKGIRHPPREENTRACHSMPDHWCPRQNVSTGPPCNRHHIDEVTGANSQSSRQDAVLHQHEGLRTPCLNLALDCSRPAVPPWDCIYDGQSTVVGRRCGEGTRSAAQNLALPQPKPLPCLASWEGTAALGSHRVSPGLPAPASTVFLPRLPTPASGSPGESNTRDSTTRERQRRHAAHWNTSRGAEGIGEQRPCESRAEACREQWH